MFSEIIPLFSTPLYKSNIQEDITAINFIKNIPYESCGSNENNNTGYISEDKYILNRPELLNIRTQIINVVNNFLKQELNFITDFKLLNSWTIKHKKGDFSPSHAHPNSLFSGVVYLQVCEESGDIVFSDDFVSPLYPNELQLDVKNYNIFNARTWTVRPSNNDILIFPSHLKHQVTLNKSNMERYVLSFNVFPVGILSKDAISVLHIL